MLLSDRSARRRLTVANSFGSDIIFETEDPQKAAAFYVTQLGFEVTDVKPNMISLRAYTWLMMECCSSDIGRRYRS